MSLIPFILYCFIVTATPGPTNILILSAVQNYSIKAALRFTYGSVLAFGILLVSSAVLNTVFINILPNIIIYMQFFGTLYMLYLAYQIYKMDVTKASTSKNSATFYTGFLLQFLNPKTVIFTLTVIPSYVLPYYNGFVPLTLNILGITVIAFIAFLLWILCGAIFKELLRKYSTITNSIMALFLVYAAVMIWF